MRELPREGSQSYSKGTNQQTPTVWDEICFRLSPLLLVHVKYELAGVHLMSVCVFKSMFLDA